MVARGYAHSTIVNAFENLRHLTRFLAARGITDPVHVTTELLEAFRLQMVRTPTPRGLPRRAGTINNALVAVRGFYRVLMEADLIPIDPARKLGLVKQTRRLPPPVLSPDEVARLLESIEPSTSRGARDRALFELMYSTGARVGEMVAMEVGDLDIGAHLARIRKGKGGKQRVVPFGTVAARHVENYLRWVRPELLGRSTSELLWLTLHGTPLGAYTVRKRLHVYMRGVGIEKRLTPHGLRHACATHLLERHADLRHIQELLGHASVSTTQVYTHVAIGHLKETLTRCHPRERGSLAEKDNDHGAGP
jgi:site-specific recombinase XerD